MTIPRVFQAYTPNVIIVDGLDECLDVPSQERLLGLLWTATMSCHPYPFDFILFSRPEPHITDFFDRVSRGSLSFDRMCIGDSFQTNRDIETFLYSRFREIRTKHHRTMQNVPDSWPGSAIISQLVQRACGQFVYATTVTKYIDSRHALPMKRLDDILSARPAKPSPYAELDLLYQQIFRSCHDIAPVLQILQLVLDSSPEVPTNEPWLIVKVLELDAGSIPVLMIGLHSVLHVPNSAKEPIKIFHASFAEFLRVPERSQEFYVPPLPDNIRMKGYFIPRFKSLSARRAHWLPQSWPGKNALASCAQRAGGQTLYADILLDYLEDDPDSRLDALLCLQPPRTSPTAELDLLCREILRDCGDVALRILQLVLATSPEFCTNEPRLVAQILDIDVDAIADYLVKLRPILHIPSTGTSDPIRIRHPSISEFLQSPQRAQQFYITPLSKPQKFGIYFETMIAAVRTKHYLPQSWPGLSALRSILQKSGGHTVYVETLTRHLNVDPSQRLAKILDSGLEQPESSPRSELYLLYRLILDSCRNPNIVSRLLQLVLKWSSGISITVISKVLEVDSTTVSLTLRELHPVCRLLHHKKETMVSFRHASFSDFLLNGKYAGPYAAPLSPDENIKAYLWYHLSKTLMLLTANAIVPQLVQMARGQEIYAQTLIRYLEKQHDFVELIEILGDARGDSPQSPNPDLDSLYHRILRTSLLSKDRCIVLQILLMVIKFDRGKTALMSNCVRNYLRADDGPLIYTICRNLCPILDFSFGPGMPCPIRFHHPSFPEFLLDEERSKEFYVGPGSLVNAEVERLIQAHGVVAVLP
ncbi:hypothetical protein VNI00_011219 [Paramarasmius palmivorus]|uniref:NACHT domain-containing protein n=1 Tax=Paramarasmius palmivorus TaxID=297713 RepID=A0AAW0CCZ0_9AGAR